MKARNPSTGNLEEVYVKALDSLPVGSEIDFTGSASDIPVGWEQVDTLNNIPIWINLYGNSAFQPKEITGVFSQYSKFEIYAFVDTNGSIITHGTATKGTAKNITYTSAYSRSFTITDTKITIAEGKYNNTTNNASIIPAFIIGIK